MRVTIAICTWNRSASLRRSLQRMKDLVIPDGLAWEVLVVNNACSDDTDAVIAEFGAMLPVRRAWEPKPGLANARNRAVQDASGDFLIWTDDDVLVDPDWLSAYCRAFERWPTASVFGGPIEPLFEDGPPRWIPPVMDQIGAAFGMQTFGSEPVRLTPATAKMGPFGGNMAMRREDLLRFPFDPALGVRHSRYSIGEESAVIGAMLEAGRDGWWTPDARVQHRVPPQQQTLAHIRRWMVSAGRYEEAARGAGHPRGAGSLRLHARMLRHEVRFNLFRRVAPPEVWMRDLVRSSHLRGRIEAMREKRSA